MTLKFMEYNQSNKENFIVLNKYIRKEKKVYWTKIQHQKPNLQIGLNKNFKFCTSKNTFKKIEDKSQTGNNVVNQMSERDFYPEYIETIYNSIKSKRTQLKFGQKN